MKNENEKTALCPKCEKTLCLDLNNVSDGYDACCVECDEDFYKCEFKYKENEKMQEVLANFTCEQLLFEVHRRNNIYISGWWNSDHIQEYTGLPSEYHTAFIKYCNDKAVGGEVGKAFEQWLEYIKEYLETYLVESIAERYELTKDEADLFSDCVQVDYDVELGFTPTLERPASEFARTTFWDSSSYLARKLTEICRPHQGNIKTYLEEAMQELINEYFS